MRKPRIHWTSFISHHRHHGHRRTGIYITVCKKPHPTQNTHRYIYIICVYKLNFTHLEPPRNRVNKEMVRVFMEIYGKTLP